jgi:hypothetical protein
MTEEKKSYYISRTCPFCNVYMSTEHILLSSTDFFRHLSSTTTAAREPASTNRLEEISPEHSKTSSVAAPYLRYSVKSVPHNALS